MENSEPRRINASNFPVQGTVQTMKSKSTIYANSSYKYIKWHQSISIFS